VEVKRLRLEGGRERKRARLEAALAGRDARGLGHEDVVRDAQLLGSLELAGHAFAWDEVRRARERPESAPAEIARLQRAAAAVAAGAPFGVPALLAWHAAASGSVAGLRTGELAAALPPPPAPAAFVAGRLEILEQWLGETSTGELRPAGRGALVLARLVEIRPFEEANGRVARLATSHVMEAAGADPPILVAGDAPRLEAALQRAFQLDTEPLVELLDEASERSLDVQLQALESAP
jgi:hypothetical protein